MGQPPRREQQPPYGPAQPPYGQPRGQRSGYGDQPGYGEQPGYGDQPGYGQQSGYGDQPRYGEPSGYGTGGYPPPPKRGNGFAVAGIVLAVLAPLLGLIFSIIGLAKSKAREGAGKALSIVGIVVSLVVSGAAVTAIAVVASSTAADPGCISAENDARQMTNTLNADSAAMTRDANNSSAERADLQKFLTDMRSLQNQWSAAEAQATHQSVKAQIAAVVSDMSVLTSSLQAIENGNTSDVNQMTTAASKLQSDANTLDSTCSSL
jgi:hypothetical protein